MKRILFTKIAMDLALELRKLSTFDEIQSAINMYRHDHNTGLLRGMSGFMLAMIETSPDHNGNTTPTAITTHPHAGFGTQTNENKRFDTTNGEPNKNSEDLCAATKGGKAKGGTGYGQCWECGEYGHPRKECPKFSERMGGGKEETLLLLKVLARKATVRTTKENGRKANGIIAVITMVAKDMDTIIIIQDHLEKETEKVSTRLIVIIGKLGEKRHKVGMQTTAIGTAIGDVKME